MTHVRTQLRNAVKTVLDGALPDHKVFEGRRYAINASELPVVDMRYLNENSDYGTMGNVLDREASLYIRVTRAASEADIDDLLDADAVAIEEVLSGNTLGELAKFTALKQTNFTDNAEGDKPLAELVLRFDIGYRTTTNDVETARA